MNATVGLSNKLDSELVGRKPVKRSHGVLAMAALDFAVMARGIQTADDAGVQSCPGMDFCGACPG